ncbi:MAG TPA: MOSC domain-containing protein [Gemmatimonadales bacterium]
MREPGRLEAIWIKRAKRGQMDPVNHATLVGDRGLVGNADQGGRRQVTLIEREVFDALRVSLSPTLDPSARRANLMLSGIRLKDTRDRTLRIGATRVRIHGETRPCHIMDEACPGLRDALGPDWRGGAFGVILDDGDIAVGDVVRWVE